MIGAAITLPTKIGIVVQNLTLFLNHRLIFNNLYFSFDAGQCAVLLGKSGVGKTCLLKVIAGLIRSDTGAVIGSDGLPLAGRIAYMGQNDLLYPWLTVRENIALGARLRGQKPDKDWANHLLTEVGLDGYGENFPATLSGGMRQRAALARTLYERRPVVLMDEPFSALDTLTRTRIQTLTSRLLAGRTVLLITHDPQEACRLGHRLWILAGQPAQLDEGQLLAGAPPREPDDPIVQFGQGTIIYQLLGSST